MFKYLLSVVLFVFSSPVLAIVNIEKINIEDDKEPVQGEVGLDFSGSSGNSDTQAVSLAGRVQWNNQSTQFVVLKYDYAESADVLSADKTFLHYRNIFSSHGSRSPELFLQLQNDEFKLLKLRTLIGGGYRFKLANTKNGYSRLGAGLFYSEEEYTDSTNSIEEVTRLNLYFTYQLKINNTTNFVTTTYYQPDIENTSDYRALEQAGFEFKLSDDLLYFLTVDISYDNDPVDDIEKDDTSYKSGIKYRF